MFVTTCIYISYWLNANHVTNKGSSVIENKEALSIGKLA